jgi:predicted RNase H-like HicB family nuclease
MNFKVIISYDPEYLGYVVDVPDLNGCMSQGKTIDEALINVKDAITGWLDAEQLLGRIYEPREKQYFLGEVFV